MKLLDRLEKRLGQYAVPRLVTVIVFGQIAVSVLTYLQQAQLLQGADIRELVELQPDRILKGEVWRIITFLFEPPRTSIIWLLIHWYVLHFIGQALEQTWGSFRLSLYLLIGYVATIGVAFFLPRDMHVTNAYLYTSLFLAFARLYPDFVFYIYFVLPVKVKWLAAITWLFFAISIYAGGWPTFWLVFATVADYFLFFGFQLATRVKDVRRQQEFKLKVAAGSKTITHECRVCGLTRDMAPRVAFRYCSKCAGQCCYCPDHIQNHEHVVDPKAESQ